MDPNQDLPFKIGQLAESKSFESGYRGAWFRCKIKGMRKKKGHISLEYFDFPDEQVGWADLYQMPESGVSQEETKLHLMVRPSFPSIYRESQIPNSCTISDLIAVVDDVWKVGDRVDWWTDSCYWSGTITHLLGEDKVKVKLPDVPLGEGHCYDVSCKDLRPSLDWSPERGWTVPISLGSEACRCCARLIQSPNLATENTISPSKEKAFFRSSAPTVSSHGSADTSLFPKISSYSPKGTPKQLSDCGLNEDTQRPWVISGLDLVRVDVGKPSSSDIVSSTHAERVSDETGKSMGTRDQKKLHCLETTSTFPEISSYHQKGTPKQLSVYGLIEETHIPCAVRSLDLGDVGSKKLSFSDSVSSIHVEHVSAETEKPRGKRDQYDYDRSSKRMRVSGHVFLNSSYSDTIEASIMDLEELVNKIKWLKRVQQFGFQYANAMTPSWMFVEDRR